MSDSQFLIEHKAFKSNEAVSLFRFFFLLFTHSSLHFFHMPALRDFQRDGFLRFFYSLFNRRCVFSAILLLLVVCSIPVSLLLLKHSMYPVRPFSQGRPNPLAIDEELMVEAEKLGYEKAWEEVHRLTNILNAQIPRSHHAPIVA